MAHHRDIPIAFSYLADLRQWELVVFAKAEPEKVTESAPNPLFPWLKASSTPSLLSLADGEVLRLTLHRRGGIYGLPEPAGLVRGYSSEFNRHIQRVLDLQSAGILVPDSQTELLVSWPKATKTSREINPWTMRDEFLLLPESNAALMEFLNRFGSWDNGISLREEGTELGRLEDPTPQAVLPFFVWQWRKELRDGILGKADSWLAERASLGFTHRRTRYPYMGITDRTCAKAIETTITLDHLRKAKWRTCKRSDCNNIFAVESEHGKVYCEQYCAHLVSVRRKRAAAKRAKKATKGKGA